MTYPCRDAVIAGTVLFVLCTLVDGAAANIVSDVLGGSSTTVNLMAADCTGLKLMAAAGVPGDAVHQYKFKGTCKKYISHRED
ncbi:MAG: hypothetical protein K2Z81_18760, partial [Cyanobacteria bacterium]|nr:hypothetical protein [Cyanobacteriota bacterium]